MKKIILYLGLFLLAISYFNNTSAVSYTNISQADAWRHDIFAQPLIEAVNNYITENNISKTSDITPEVLTELTTVANQTIASIWWWGWVMLTEEDERYSKLARIENWNLIVWCWNADMAIFTLEPGETTPEPVAIPEPVITSNTITQNSCSSHISSWSTSWSDCQVEWNWNWNWNITCKQTASHSPNYSQCWSKTCTITYSDWIVVWTNCTECSWCSQDASEPSDTQEIKTITAKINNPNSTCNWIYGNNSDTCKVILNISAETNQNRWIVGWWNKLEVYWVTDKSGEKADRINNTWKALDFSNLSSNNPWTNTSNGFNIELDWIKSKTPFSSSTWEVWIKLWWVDMNIKNISYNFKKPFEWIINVYDSINNNWNWKPTVWTQMQYKLLLDQKSSLSLNNVSDYKLDDFTNKIQWYWDGISVQWVSVNKNTLDDKNWALFNARLNATNQTGSLNQNPWLQVNNAIVSYKLWWENISYYLSENDYPSSSDSVKISWESFKTIKLTWNIQWDWKSNLTWQEENISNLSAYDLRTTIRKNAYSHIKSMKSWDIFGWVKYVEWDISISWEINWYETLVVKDWNVIIDWNLNSTWKKFWIVVLKDSYNVENWYSWKWNVYIKPNVTKVNAVIYSDGWVISVNNSWNIYNEDSVTRSNELNKQLEIKWNLFTRNTIWWSVASWWNYILPWNVKIWQSDENFVKAMQYDLNYLRVWNSWCDKNSNWNCSDNWESQNPFVINYDSSVQTNPPKLFEN